jgi:antitoxin component of MazEF toxin-antitoxin module
MWWRKLTKTGGSLVVAIPGPLVKSLKLKPGVYLRFELTHEKKIEAEVIDETRKVGFKRGK